MDAKTALTGRAFCPIPWTGLMFNFDGSVKNCIRSPLEIGNIKREPIEHILAGPLNRQIQDQMLASQQPSSCRPCYDLERDKNRFDIISDRIFYMRELKSVPFDVYRPNNHELHTIDVRWSNLCNFACVYCSPRLSSKWAAELKVVADTPTPQQIADFKKYIFDHAQQLRHVYMAGGEPLLMKENLELLEILRQENPGVNLRVNTNLSKVDTRIFETICEFPNVHWTVSVESQGSEFEYIRYGGSWEDFLANLKTISELDHKVSFNMLHFLLNFRSIFDCIDYLRSIGYHANSFIVGALLSPIYLNIRHLPDSALASIKSILQTRLSEKPGYLLEDSYKNLLHYIEQPFEKDLVGSLEKIKQMDQRRGLDSTRVFEDLYKLI